MNLRCASGERCPQPACSMRGVLMKPGAKWQLFIPPELAYGPRSQQKIPSNSLLIFDVNVVSAEAANAPPKAPPGTPPPVKHN